MTTQDIWKAFAKTQASVERKYLSKIYSSLNKQNAAAADYYRQYGANLTMANINTVVPYEPLMSNIKALYRDAGLKNAARAYQQVKQAAGEKARLGFSQEWIDRVMQYFRLFLLNKSVLPITETTKKRIMEVLEESNQEGWGVDKTVRELKDTDISKKRAKVIVRTESVRASNYGSMVGAAQMGLKLNKEWIAVMDKRTRHDHRDLNGQQVPFEEKFTADSGDRLMFPGDPDASAEETIMCRCVLGYHPVRDARGRLIEFTYTIV